MVVEDRRRSQKLPNLGKEVQQSHQTKLPKVTEHAVHQQNLALFTID